MKMKRVVKGSLLAFLLFSLFSCSYAPATYGDDLMGEWRSLDGGHTFYIIKPNGNYWVSSRKIGLCGHFSVDTYPIREEDGFLYMDTGFYVWIDYDPAADRIRLRPGNEYRRISKPKINN